MIKLYQFNHPYIICSLLVLALLLLVSVHPVQDRNVFQGRDDYYVSINGDDANPGTQSQPWRTIQFAANFLFPRGVMAKPSIPADITIDFRSVYQNQNSMNGFLHAVDRTSPTRPPDNMINNIQPKLWRIGDWNIYARALDSGAKVVFILSDSYGYDTPPYEDYEKWEDYVRSTAKSHPDEDLVWDIWNEPDYSFFWKGTREQFFETYRRAEKILREELGPDVLVSGPSISNFNIEYMKEFLDYCTSNECEVNALSWHELDSYNIATIEEHLQDIQQYILNNPDYSALDIQETHINEYSDHEVQYSPGASVGYLYYLERGNADFAAKACWPAIGEDWSDMTNCDNGTLDGMLDPKTSLPRAVWWVHKIYADGIANRVVAQPNVTNVVGIANNKFTLANQRGQVLIGYFKELTLNNDQIRSISIRLNNLETLGFRDGEYLRLKLEKIPNTQEEILEAPIPIQDAILQINNNSIYYTIVEAALNEAFVLTIFSLKSFYVIYLPLVIKQSTSNLSDAGNH